MNVGTVATAIKTALSGISGLHFYDTIPDAPIVPCVIVGPSFENLDYAIDGADVVFIVQVLSATVNTKAGQQLLYNYTDSSGPLSIPALLHGVTLGGAVSSAKATRIDYGFAQSEGQGTKYWSARISVDVLT